MTGTGIAPTARTPGGVTTTTTRIPDCGAEIIAGGFCFAIFPQPIFARFFAARAPKTCAPHLPLLLPAVRVCAT
jgi:hypothetical protein